MLYKHVLESKFSDPQDHKDFHHDLHDLHYRSNRGRDPSVMEMSFPRDKNSPPPHCQRQSKVNPENEEN